jgi:hypothetical protein
MGTRACNEVEFKLAIQVARPVHHDAGSGRSLGWSRGWANSFPCPTPGVEVSSTRCRGLRSAKPPAC